MADETPTYTRGERCPECGQPLVLGVCMLCGRRPSKRASSKPPATPPATLTMPPLTTPPPTTSEPTTSEFTTSEPTTSEPSTPEFTTPAAGAPRTSAPAAVRTTAPRPPRDWTQTLLAIGIGLLIVTLLASIFAIVRISSLDSKLKDEAAARSTANDRVTVLEGTLKNVEADQQAVHSQLDAQAAADPTTIASHVQASVYTVETPGGAIGSAWVAASDHVTAKFVTNYHVIADAWEKGITVVKIFQDQGATFDGTIEQALPDVDLALVSVTADLPKLKQSNETPRGGETIVVIGSPLGFGGSVSTGTVSALRDVDGINLIQFAAPTSPGNSGGPIVNSLGEVIGITELDFGRVIQGSDNAKFAIPVNQVCVKLQVC